MRMHRDRDRKFAIAENFYRMLRLEHSSLAQHVGGDGSSEDLVAERRQPFQADNIKFLAEDVGEAALRHAAVQRHLAAFETADQAHTGARTLALVSASGRLAHAGAHSATHARALFRRLLRCSE